jgi:hypothetical protein
MMEELVLYAQACPECEGVPFLRLRVPSEVLEFFASGVKGWTFEQWVFEKLEEKGIFLPDRYHYFINTLAVAILRKDNINPLPLVVLP